jgi:uncharacterized protein
MAGLTPKIPLSLDEQDGAYLLIKDYRRLVSQNFRNLLLTAPGERVMDTQFGVGIRNFLFDNAGSDLNNRIENKIREQISIYMPFIQLQGIDFNESPEYGNLLSMSIYYYVGPLNLSDNLSISLSSN